MYSPGGAVEHLGMLGHQPVPFGPVAVPKWTLLPQGPMLMITGRAGPPTEHVGGQCDPVGHRDLDVPLYHHRSAMRP
jgi:hypothetical protein